MNEPVAVEPTSASEQESPEPPRPTFDILPLSDEVRRALAEMAYVNPTPVQLAVWDPATRGKDAVVQARTGTGKTASFGLPLIDHVIKRSIEGVQALVLCPTRELAVQVSTEIDRLAQYKGTKSIAIYGGASMERQVSALEQGAQLVVGTPGRVLDHIRRGTLSTSHIRLLVLDEADEMLSMGFERELTQILEKLPPNRQTLLFSATVPPDIDRIARSRLREPEFITLSGDAIGALSIQHFTYLVPGDKIGALVQIIETENPESAIVFCNTRDATEAVAGALQSRGYDADWLNGDLPQSERESVMARTRAGKLRFLVATDVAARGIDISHLTHVINFDFPQDAETYVHRTGRTGRAGRTGTAVSLILPQDIGGLYLLRLTYKIRPVERVVPSANELKTRAEADVVAMLAEALLPRGTHEDDRALARRLLTHDQVEGILAGLLREYLGARPTAQADASDARRKTTRRATLRTRDGRRSSDAPALDAPSSDAPALKSGSAEAQPGSPAAEASAPAAQAEPRAHGGRGFEGRGFEGRDRDRPRDRDRDRDRDRGPRDRREPFPRREPRAVDGLPAVTIEEAAALAPRSPDVAAEARPAEPRREESRRDESRREDRSERRSLDRTGERRGPERPRRAGGAAGFVDWTPPQEEGDDEPLIPSKSGRDLRPRADGRPAASSEPKPEASLQAGGSLPQVGDDTAYVELFMGIGRRDGTRAQDLLRALVEQGGVDKDHIRRIRVRDRHAFVAIRKDQADQAIARLHGTTVAGKSGLVVELARERAGSDDSLSEAPAEG